MELAAGTSQCRPTYKAPDCSDYRPHYHTAQQCTNFPLLNLSLRQKFEIKSRKSLARLLECRLTVLVLPAVSLVLRARDVELLEVWSLAGLAWLALEAELRLLAEREGGAGAGDGGAGVGDGAGDGSERQGQEQEQEQE